MIFLLIKQLLTPPLKRLNQRGLVVNFQSFFSHTGYSGRAGDSKSLFGGKADGFAVLQGDVLRDEVVADAAQEGMLVGRLVFAVENFELHFVELL